MRVKNCSCALRTSVLGGDLVVGFMMEFWFSVSVSFFCNAYCSTAVSCVCLYWSTQQRARHVAQKLW